MYWFLLFLGVVAVWLLVVVAVWLLVLALLAKKVWGQGKALARELVAAQSKLEEAQSQAGSGRTGGTARSPA